MTTRVLRLLALILGAALALTGCGSSTPVGGLGTVGTVGTATPSGTGTPSGPAPSTDGGSAASTGPASSTPTAPATGASFADPGQVRQILADATRDVVATSSYDYRHLASAMTAGLAATTGGFTAKYRQTFVLLSTEAPKVRAVQVTSIQAAGVGPATATDATVLVFGRAHITNSTTPAGRDDPFTATVRLQPVAGRWRIADLTAGDTVTGALPGNDQLAAAGQAARTTVTDTLSLTRTRFSSDYARALATTTGPLHEDLIRNRAGTAAALTRGRLDLGVTIRAVAAVSASGDTVVVLVAADATRTVDGKAPVTTPERLSVTVTRSGRGWLAADVSEVGGH